MINKTLFYFFYCNKEITEISEVYLLHLELIKRNINIFNKVNIILAFDDPNNTKLINEYKTFIIGYLCYAGEIDFIIVQNDKYNREGYHFYSQIIRKLDTFDGLIFWGHSKSDSHLSKKCIYKWITACHFINFYNVKDVENKLIYDKYIAYGSLPCILKKVTSPSIVQNSYIFDGSFFWINPRKILNECTDRLNNYIMFYEVYYNNKICEEHNLRRYIPFYYCTELFLSDICDFPEKCTTLNSRKPTKLFLYEQETKSLQYISLFTYHMYSIENSIENANLLTSTQLSSFYKLFDDVKETLHIEL